LYVITVSISYELERHGRNLFINNRRALRMSSANANLKMELASRMLEDGQREMEAKRAMVRHISHEIRYVGVRCVGRCRCAVLRCAVLHCSVCCTVLCCTVLYSAVPCCTVLR
jgi:hypothetical protein